MNMWLSFEVRVVFSDEATVKDQSRYMYFFCIKPSK